MLFKIGDSVKVKEGIMCPDNKSVRMSHWQGRVFDTDDDDVVGIRWDSITLKQLPLEYITKSEEEGLDWTEIYLRPDEIESASPRDTKAQADETAEAMESKYSWLGDDEGRRIHQVIAEAEDEIQAWHQHLKDVLTFPFEAEVSEPQDDGPLRCGDKVRVHRISESDDGDLYGLLVDVTRGRERFVFPLGDLTVLDKTSANFLPVQDYCVWFANR